MTSLAEARDTLRLSTFPLVTADEAAAIRAAATKSPQFPALSAGGARARARSTPLRYDLHQWLRKILNRALEHVEAANGFRFNLMIVTVVHGHPEYLANFLSYGLGDFCSWHRDGPCYPHHPPRDRDLDVAFSLQLSAEDDYAGGELELEVDGRHEVASRRIGDCVTYLASTRHQVRPVTAGKRYSLLFSAART